jgi:hypothetical protein
MQPEVLKKYGDESQRNLSTAFSVTWEFNQEGVGITEKENYVDSDDLSLSQFRKLIVAFCCSVTTMYMWP